MPNRNKTVPPAREPETSKQLARLHTNESAIFDPTADGTRDRPLHVNTKTSLTRADVVITDDAALWAAIRNRTDAIRGDRYEEFISRVLCDDESAGDAVCLPEDKVYGQTKGIANAVSNKRTELLGTMAGYGVDAYNLIKYATQAFLLLETGVVVRQPINLLDDDEDKDEFFDGEESRIGERVPFTQLETRLETFL